MLPLAQPPALVVVPQAPPSYRHARRATLLDYPASVVQRWPQPRSRRPPSGVYRAHGYIEHDQGGFRLAQAEQPEQPLTPEPGAQAPEALAQATPEEPFQPFTTGFDFGGPSLLPEDRQPLVSKAAVSETVTSNESAVQVNSQLGEALAETTDTVKVQRRSSAFFDPQIRGFRSGDIYTQVDGVYSVPARQDLDSVLSTIDPSSIQDVIVIPGPYGVRYGPGFSFLDIARNPTPRYDCFENHLRLGTTYRHNGRQYNNGGVVYGGGPNFGYRINYGDNVGVDYRSGDSIQVPASFHSRNIVADFGFDTFEDQHVEFTYTRLDQTDTEYAAQFFDIDFLGAQSYNLRLIDEDPTAPWSRLVAQGWYSESRYTGDTLNQSKRDSGVIPRIETALGLALAEPDPRFAGFTEGDVQTTGARLAVTHGEADSYNLSWGPDFRYIRQQIDESFFISNLILPEPPIFTNMPQSEWVDPGFFAELQIPLTCCWTATIGGRVDWLHTTADRDQLRRDINGIYSGSLPGVFDDTSILQQNDILYAFYLNNRLELAEGWSVNLGGGHSQRPPTLTDRYADGLFLAIIQNGFSRVVGDPNLDVARNWQLDAGIEADNDWWRARMRGYHARIHDYLTYRVNPIIDPTGARILLSTNTNLALLSGCDASCDIDLNDWWTAFGVTNYVYGVDDEIDQPLPSIPPLDSRVGLRLHDPEQGQTWGFEFAARIVNDQDQVGALRLGLSPDMVATVEQQTPGFTTYLIRGYWNVSENLNLVAGIENLFDKQYLEHLNIRLPANAFFPEVAAYNPGFFPYFGGQWTY